MRTSYDAIYVNNLPSGGDLYLGYDDGNWPDANAIAARFPGKTVIRTTTNPADNEGDMLDIEKGDATPQDAPGWIVRRRDAGHRGPIVYFAESSRSEVVNAFAAASVPLPGFFVADYPGVGTTLQRPTDVGHQYGQGGNGAYDISVVVDYLPGIDPAPTTSATQTTPTSSTPSTSTGDDDMPLSDIVTYKAGQSDFFQISPAGDLYHKFSFDGGKNWASESLPSYIKFRVARPLVRVTTEGCEVYVEDNAAGFVYRYFQAASGDGSVTWAVGKTP